MELTTVITFINPWEAYIAKGRLEAEGVSAFIAHEYYIWIDWPLAQALGGVKLQVEKQDKEIASKIMHNHIHGCYEQYLENEGYEVNIRACPKCKSLEYKNTFSFPLLILSFFTLGFCSVIFPVRRDQYVCKQCKHRWQ